MSTPPKIIMRGGLGLRLDCLKGETLAWLQKRLTLTSRPYKDNPPQVVRSFHTSNGYFWVPRFFDWMEFWPKIQPAGWQWICPLLDYDLESKFTPIAEKQQPEAIETLVEHLKKNSSGICVLPTDVGKTYVALEIGRQFQTPIAVLIHKGDMIDNWVEHAESHLGVPAHDVAIIKENSYAEGKPVTICSIQTLLSRDLPSQFYEQFGFLIGDEIHHYGARTWSKVISRFPARYRLGLSANPVRDDGLDPIVRWNFGKVGFGVYKRKTGQLPLVCLTRYPGVYNERKYHDWKQIQTTEGPRWVMGSANALKYAKVLAADEDRNSWLVGKIIDARSKGRRILIFSKLRAHIKDLHDEFVKRWTESTLQAGGDPKDTRVKLLWGGLKTAERKIATTGDVTFTTYGFSREATNLPHKDTLVVATPAENALQTVGRLRDKGAANRMPFMVVDVFEGNDYSFKKASQRAQTYASLGIKVKRFEVRS